MRANIYDVLRFKIAVRYRPFFSGAGARGQTGIQRRPEKYDLIVENYPQSGIRYKAVFMKGLILLENLKDNKRAVETFDELLAEYPDCDLADDAAVLREIAAGNGDIMSAFEDSLKQE